MVGADDDAKTLVAIRPASRVDVAVYDRELACWHCYVTNLSADTMNASHFTAEMPSGNRHVAEA